MQKVATNLEENTSKTEKILVIDSKVSADAMGTVEVSATNVASNCLTAMAVVTMKMAMAVATKKTNAFIL